MSERMRMGLVIPKQYYLFGTPIQQSLSPTMHNSAFRILAMPHNYSLNEQVDVKSYLPLIQSDSLSTFAGASVTIPHKESIMQYLDEIRHPADIIGAINTISVESIDLTEHFRSKQKLVG
jgi:pentafunctional AROM polypeptide